MAEAAAEGKGFPLSKSAKRALIIVTACTVTMLALSAGLRQSLGMFIRPVSFDLHLGREVISFAIAMQTLLVGLCAPFSGAIADRFGTVKVATAGAFFFLIGLWFTSQAQTPMGLYLSIGLVMGLALTATSMSIMFGAVGRVVQPQYRTIVFGVVTAGGSLGQFLVIPMVGAVLSSFSWRESLLVMMAGAIVMIFIAQPLRIADRAPRKTVSEAASLPQALREARNHRGFQLLNASYFVCGFHVSFMATHFPAFLADRGMDGKTVAIAFAFIGLFNIFGSLFFGYASSRWSKRHVLAWLYGIRSLIFIPLLFLPMTPALALGFGAAMGFLYLGTVPPTSGIVAQVFGVRYMSMMFGIVFLAHQVGGFFGAWIAGYLYDKTGSYEIVWMINIGLGIAATLLVLPIDDRPIQRKEAVPA